METVVNEVEVGKPKKRIDEWLELIIVIMLGVTALFTAWATWIGGLHGGNQAANFAKANNMSADGNSRWNEASQSLMKDYITYNEMNSMEIDMAYANKRGDNEEVDRLEWKIEEMRAANMSEEFQEAYAWAIAQSNETGVLVTPFDKEGYTDSYYTDAQSVLNDAEVAMDQGEKDMANGDKYGLVTVIYTVVLFVLGIVSTFKGRSNRVALTVVALFAFVISTIYMLTVPMPSGFDLISYITGSSGD
ncbi:MAG: hypothetical protein P0Y55_07820 [Candidatus Cohnella colombiensis]|uniref:Uncharacterized protein n=1 Tax=Candidatus Cohnella colombiensis TaxID=3121368 RepID=A0AA95JEC7_9BACL|nr:MAG: hypothetical protein P0Y55_07820 [Cohnella sp.]